MAQTKPGVTDLQKVGDTSQLLPAAFSNQAEFGELLAANMGGDGLSPFDLERVKVPAGGSTYWMVSTLEKPNGEPREYVDGVIVHARFARTYWSVPMEERGTGGSTPPDCYSDDGVTGHGTPGGPCHACAYAKFGSAPKGGNAQACKQSRLLFMVSPESMLPRVVPVPPGSLKVLKQYMARLSNLARGYWTVVTRLSLEKVKNQSGIEYARVVPTVTGMLTPEQVVRIKEYAEALRPVLEQVRVDRTDVDGPQGE